MPFTNPPKVDGDQERGEEEACGCTKRPGFPAALATPPAGLWLIAVTYRQALSEERAGELAHSIPAQQSSLIKN